MVDLSKRRLLKQGLSGLSVCGVGALWSTAIISGCDRMHSFLLESADDNGVRLRSGLRSKIVARSSQQVIDGSSYLWHGAPDGGACFATDDGGWIYVSNSEMDSEGGVGAIVFDSKGDIQRAYSILGGTSRNCAGGATPWGSWLSCEETRTGRVWECYPDGQSPAIVRPALGVFNHEAVAVDELNQQLYLTEDEKDGCLYRFTANEFNKKGFPDLTAGTLEVAVVANDSTTKLDWLPVSEPLAELTATRYQVPSAKKFNGGEGIAYHDGRIIFSTKGDDRIWAYQIKTKEIDVLYDANEEITPVLTGVDNVIVSQNGDIYVAEDRGNLQVVVIDNEGSVFPIVQLEGHRNSEVTGLAFSPDGKRLYFSSQRGETNSDADGITYEIQGF